MAWNTGNSYVTTDPISNTTFNGIGNDLRTWGGNVDAGGYNLANIAQITGASNLLTINKTTIMLDTAAADTLELQNNNSIGVLFRMNPTASGGVAWRMQATASGAGQGGGKFIWQHAGGDNMCLDSSGRFGVGTSSPTISGTGLVHFIGDTVRLVPTARTPANSAATGNDGELCADSSYVYLHTGGSWRRAALSTF